MEKELLKAIRVGDIDKVKHLISYVDLNKNQHKIFFKIPLLLAIDFQDYDIVKLLLENGADVNIKDNYNKNGLIISTNEDIINLLLEYNIDIDINRNKDKFTIPLLYHVYFNMVEMVELLLENGADVNIRDKNDENALYFLEFIYDNRIIDILMKYNIECHVTRKNNNILPNHINYIKQKYPDFYKQCKTKKMLNKFNI